MITAVVLVLIAAALLFGSGWLSCMIARRLEAKFPPQGVFVTANGVRMHVLDLPAEQRSDPPLPTVLLVHGANLCGEDMRLALGARLSRRLRVIIPDRPGQGYSAPGLGPLASPAYQVTLLREVLRERGVTGPLLVVGHSFGGLIALRYALDNPDRVQGLVVINPTTHPRPRGIRGVQRVFDLLMKPSINYTVLPPMFMMMMDRVATRIFRPEPPPPDYADRSRLGLALMAKRFSGSLQEYSGLRDQLTDHVARYPALRVPTVIIAGTADPVVPPQIHAEALAQALPRARMIRIPGAGHMAHHAHAELIAAEIERLAGCAGGATPLRAVERPLRAGDQQPA